MDAVFSTINLHNSSLAIPFRPFASRCAARIPMGVAALPKPKKLAHTLAERQFSSLESVLAEGNIRPNRGRSSLDNFPVMPACSNSLPTPVHRQIDPAMEIARVIPACAPLGTAADRADPLPSSIAAIKETATIPVHRILITIKNPSRISLCGNREGYFRFPMRHHTPHFWAASILGRSA